VGLRGEKSIRGLKKLWEKKGTFEKWNPLKVRRYDREKGKKDESWGAETNLSKKR